MDDELLRRLDESGYDWPGFAADYDRFRPRPPAVLLELLPLLVGVDRLRLVVDLGSGTGLSARVWTELADEVVAIEPNKASLVDWLPSMDWLEVKRDFIAGTKTLPWASVHECPSNRNASFTVGDPELGMNETRRRLAREALTDEAHD
jgi:hypothetical protein